MRRLFIPNKKKQWEREDITGQVMQRARKALLRIILQREESLLALRGLFKEVEFRSNCRKWLQNKAMLKARAVLAKYKEERR